MFFWPWYHIETAFVNKSGHGKERQFYFCISAKCSCDLYLLNSRSRGVEKSHKEVCQVPAEVARKQTAQT